MENDALSVRQGGGNEEVDPQVRKKENLRIKIPPLSDAKIVKTEKFAKIKFFQLFQPTKFIRSF